MLSVTTRGTNSLINNSEVAHDTYLVLFIMCKQDKKFVIPFYLLRRAFPNDTMWVDGCAEIIGYSPKENLHIVIADGTRVSSDGKYLVHEYRPKDRESHEKQWYKGKHPMKYLIDENYADVVSERWIDFSIL